MNRSVTKSSSAVPHFDQVWTKLKRSFGGKYVVGVGTSVEREQRGRARGQTRSVAGAAPMYVINFCEEDPFRVP